MSDSPNMTPPPAPPAPPMTPPPTFGGEPSSNAKLVSLLGWIFAPLGFIAIFLDEFKNDRFVRAHVIQAAALWIAIWAVNGLLAWTIIVPMVLGLAFFVFQIYMAIQAFNGKSFEVPYLYGFVKQFIDQA